MKLLQQGAEAKIFLTPENQILKSRIPKSYRHETLDNKIRTRRTKSEAKILAKASEAKINVPTLIHTELHNLTIEYIKGDRLSQTLNSYEPKKQISIMKKLGRQVAKLHKANIIHSDLTTSNVILKTCHLPSAICHQQSKIYIIDFGLSYISIKIEDKAVDLHLLKQALQAKHFQNWKKLFQSFCQGYKWQDSKTILERIEIVEKRGRYKH
ncbi:MAG: KEOPS complex kinase/ATPase Bud32 [archaeon]